MGHDIAGRLKSNGQEHILNYLERMNAGERQSLLEDAARIDLEQIAELFGSYRSLRGQGHEQKIFEAAEVLAFPPTDVFAAERRRLAGLGEDLLRQGRVAIFLVAGGQGTRLGYNGPKGCFPVSPFRRKSLFQLFAESIMALRSRYGAALPWYIMTSQENNAATCAFFKEHGFFGLGAGTVRFIIQKENPSLDLDGRLIISPDKKIFKNPNGHGGSLYAMKDSGALAQMADLGIDEIFYFQVDNPLANIADPLFIGAHAENRAQMSTKVVRKVDPAEKVGIIGRVNGRLGCIEYSELSQAEIAERLPDGRLRFSSANMAIHMLNRAFVEKLTSDPDFRLPYHIAVKGIDCLAPDMATVHKIDGIKFEMFIFDALGFAERSVTLEVPREEEFSPVKNSAGADSPDTARAATIARHRSWLQGSGKLPAVPADLVIEISPLYALDAEEFAEKFRPPPNLSSPVYIE
ncbi:MAG: UTP--glucose-1-phosphate uridylyltransferase [Deltaproteobacteria bacterium]|nr:UTP--glucose-1-phosphate uridylyltransferase [Deltaproteobacteria bacterium]